MVMNNLKLCSLILSIFLLQFSVSNSFAQTGRIRIWGEVKDAQSSQFIEGVSIKLKKSLSQTQTDAQGSYYLLLRYPVDTIIFSKVGFQEVAIEVKDAMELPLIVQMKSSNVLIDEVIIESGLQRIPKERATGSYEFIDSATWNQRIGKDVISRIDGLVSGLQTNKQNPADPTLEIRGISSLGYESMKPLIILDNFPYEGRLESLNPNDVESISILKDAAASSIWGARAGNGVIVIKSKAASKGERVSTNFTINSTVSPRPNLFTANHMSVDSYIEMEKFLYEKGYYSSRFNMNNGQVIPQVAELLESNRLGLISEQDLNKELARLEQVDYRDDFQKYLYQPSINQQYFSTVSGSNKTHSYIISAGYDDGKEHLQGNQNKRFNLRADNAIRFSENLSIDLGIRLALQTSQNNSPGGYGNYPRISGYNSLASENNTPVPLDIHYRGIFTDTIGQGKLLDWKYRPLDELRLSDNENKLKDVIINFGVNYKWDFGLAALVKIQQQFGENQLRQIHHKDSYFARNLINTFSQEQNGSIHYIIPIGGIKNTINNYNSANNIRAQLEFNNTYGDHQINSLIGAEVRESKRESLSDIKYGYDSEKLTHVNIDPTTMYPSLYNLFGYSYIPYGSNSNKFLNRFISVFGNAAYTYKSRYTVTGSIRKDASNLFGVNTNQKWNPLWSLGGLWHLAKEPYFNIPSVNKFSLRATYGYSGNIPVNATALTQIDYYGQNNSAINQNYATIAMGPNPTLRWETVKTINFGVDFDLFKNSRITGSIEYYRKESTDIFNSTRLDPIVGMTIQPKNSASMKGYGTDVNLSVNILQKVIKWNSHLLFSYSDYKVTKNLNPPSVTGIASSGTSLFPLENYHPYLLVSYRWAGLNPLNGNPRGYLNNEISEDYYQMQSNSIEDQVIHGPAISPYFGALRNNIGWKKWNLTVGINYKFGHYFRKPTLNYTSLFQYGDSNGNQEYENRWRKEGDEKYTDVPAQIFPSDSRRDNFYAYSEINVQKADYIRLNEIRLQYQWIPQNTKSLKSIVCYTYIDNMNVFVWNANKWKIDPENIKGYRRPVTYSVGIQLNLQ